jgi:hypothetical protein
MTSLIEKAIALAVLDGGGIYGHFLHYALIIAMTGGTVLVFIYLWIKRRLDMDEEPKIQMMESDEEERNSR